MIPSINLGGMRIDIAFLVLMFITSCYDHSHRLTDPQRPAHGDLRRCADRECRHTDRRGWSCRCGSITLPGTDPHKPAAVLKQGGTPWL